MTAKADRPYDIVVYGATGYTGRLVAEYLAHHYQGKGPKWAMAGRSAAKLAEVRDLIGAPADTPLIVANSDDPASMKALAEQTRVVITTVGPYQLYGEPLLAACVAAGQADAGLGIASAAHAQGLSFVPLLQECYWLVCLKSVLDSASVQMLGRILQSQAWQVHLNALAGYAPIPWPGQVQSLKKALPWWQFKEDSAHPGS